MKTKILVMLICSIIFITSCSSSKNLNLPCGINGGACQMTPLGNYYDLEAAKDWDCEKMSMFSGEKKNFCMALKHKDTQYCDKISDDTRMVICKAIVENNFELCQQLPEGSQQSCYFQVGADNKNLDACKMVNERTCFNLAIEKIVQDAISTNNPALCEQLPMVESLVSVEYPQTNYPSEVLKRTCYTEIAIKKRDFLICNFLEQESLIEYCVSQSDMQAGISKEAIQNRDLNICRKFAEIKTNWRNKDGGYLFSCFTTIAKELNDPQICNELKGLYANEDIDQFNINNCLLNV